jgi:protein-glucosylgalactosylhydroxylysine glucosidase
LYRNHPTQAFLEKYKDLVFSTADFMASFAFYEKNRARFILGKGVIAAQERFKPEETFNPTYELVYWHWALSVAQLWRRRLNLEEKTEWTKVIKELSVPAVHDGKYLFAESATDSYSNLNYRTDHPSVLGALGMLPKTVMIDTMIMKKTLNWIWENWNWNDTWGWDFPMVAMTASKLGMSKLAIEALLMPMKTNTFLKNGHNFQDNRLTIYLPGNGGLLSAIAMICSEWEKKSGKGRKFYDDNGLYVKWEGFDHTID